MNVALDKEMVDVAEMSEEDEVCTARLVTNGISYADRFVLTSGGYRGRGSGRGGFNSGLGSNKVRT